MKRLACLAVTLLLVLPALGQSVQELLAQADALFQEVWTAEYTAANHDALAARLREAIALYEQALAEDEGNVDVLATLSRCSYMLADIFAAQNERRDIHEQGQAYGEQALRATPGFADLEQSEGFLAAVQACEHVPALYWTYGNWARKVELGGTFGLIGAAIRGDDKKLRAMVERCLELDPDYLAGGAYRAAGAYWAKHPFGKDLDRAKALFEQAIAAFPDYLENKYFLAQYYLVPEGKWTEAAQVLDEIAAAPLGDYALENSIVKLKAQALLEEEV
ncbi:MAG: TRAP transporter TatT component family protein [Candidatus Bipolaricaulaceae bacterium]